MRLLALLFLLTAAPGLSAQQDAAPDEPIPAGAVALLDGEPVAKPDYLEYLYRRFGKRGVREMIGEMLVIQEAARFGIVVDEAAVTQAANEREEAMRRGQDQERFLAGLERNGQDYGMFRANLEREIQIELMLRQLVLRTRVITDQKIEQLFERKYGAGGIRMKIRHIVAMPNILRAERVRAGADPNAINMAALREEAQGIADAARARLLAGEDFAEVAKELSHDRVTKDRGGEIDNYNGRLYGPGFRTVIDGLQPGEYSTVVESGAGFHVVELLDRTITKLEDVREELVNELLQAEPSFQEMSGYRNTLIDRADIRLF